MQTKLTMEQGLYVHDGQPVDDFLDAVALDRDERSRSIWGGDAIKVLPCEETTGIAGAGQACCRGCH